MSSRTLLELRSRAKRRAKMENSSFLSDAEWNENLNYAASELRDLMTSKAGDDYFAISYSFNLVSGQEEYALPADFYKAISLELLAEDGQYYAIHRYEIGEQAALVDIGTEEIRYRLRQNNVVFRPKNMIGGRTVKLWYVPTLSELVVDTDVLDGFNGWDEFIILRAAVTALDAEEQDTSKLDLSLERLKLRIESMAPNRDQSQPMRIRDNEQRREWI